MSNSATGSSSWHPLTRYCGRLESNADALAIHRPGLATLLRELRPRKEFFTREIEGDTQIGIATETGIQPLPHPVPPAAGRQIAGQLYPGGACDNPVLVTGEDLGWLWTSIYELPCHSPTAPGHRPPLFFLVRDLERLWLMLHVQNWDRLLADARVQLFVGPDAFEQFRRSLTERLFCPWPRLSVTIDPTLWPVDQTINSVIAAASTALTAHVQGLDRAVLDAYADHTPSVIADRFQAGKPLRILGVTSRYTTFLQYSMRDWLDAFRQLGHETELVIEAADHEICGAIAHAKTCARFKPDLVVIIDHFRKELGGFPAGVPVAMWVQDALPSLFTPAAGDAQGPLDYAMGFARLKMVHEFRYPASRYMPAIVGVNEARFRPQALSAADRARWSCDVAFVSHASMPAETILRAEAGRIAPGNAAVGVLWSIYEELRGVYDAGGCVTEPIVIQRMIDRAMLDARLGHHPEQMAALLDLFSLRINNALFRHQSLLWLADMGVDLRLYGRGWEAHPRLKQFARGVAENESALPLIYNASRINLQVTPHGAVHQRLMEGLAAGGFFLIRECPGDRMEREFQAIYRFCQNHGVTTDADLLRLADSDTQSRIQRVRQMLAQDPFAGDYPFIEALRSSEECGYMRSAGTVFGDDYDAVAYPSASRLREKVTHFLLNAEERDTIARSMRHVALERFTYRATSQRLISFIAADLAKKELSTPAMKKSAA